MGTPAADHAQGIATDSSGNVYVAGWTEGEFDGNPGIGDVDMFLSKYNYAGTKLWTRQFGTASEDNATSVAISSDGGIYVAGWTFGGFDGATNAGLSDLLLVKYNATGIKQSSRQLGTTAADAAMGVATDAGGSVYVAGLTAGGLDGNTNTGANDACLVKYDAAGVKQWTRQLGSTATDLAWDVAVASSGDVYIAGSTAGGIGGNINAGLNDVFLARYTPGGVRQWTRQFGTATLDEGLGVAVGGGYVYVVGETFGGLDGNSSAGLSDIFIAKYDAGGARQWTRQLGTSEGDYALAVTADTAGNLFLVGTTMGDLDGNVSAGWIDLYVMKYGPDGVRAWTRQMGTTLREHAVATATDGDGNVYAAGRTEGGLGGNTNAGGDDVFIAKFNASGQVQ